MKKLQLLFNKKYKTIHRIGLTAHSQIYKAIDIITQQPLAIKLEPYQQSSQSELQKQSKIYRLAAGGVGIPNIYWYGIEHQYRVLVTDVYGPSLENLLTFCQGTFTLKTVLMIAQQIIDRIQWLHNQNLVYNDIDTENFLVGLGKKADKIFIVDFGNVRKFIDNQKNHYFIQKQQKPLKNKLRFRSIHTHINKKSSRRDDLQSLGYLLIYLLNGSLPWDQIQQVQAHTKQLLIKQLKSSIPIEKLCQNLPQQFQQYFNYVKTLQFQEEPDYVWIKRLFKDLFQKMAYQHNGIMDWAEKHHY